MTKLDRIEGKLDRVLALLEEESAAVCVSVSPNGSITYIEFFSTFTLPETAEHAPNTLNGNEPDAAGPPLDGLCDPNAPDDPDCNDDDLDAELDALESEL